MFVLRVMTYVVYYKLFWNWIGVVRFCCLTLSSLLFFTSCVVVITEYLNPIIFWLNPIILIECWPAQSTFVFPTIIKITKAFGFIQIGHITKIFNAKKCAAGKIFWWKHCAAGKTYETNCAAGKIFLTESWCVICPVDVVYNSLFTNHSSESSFFN